MTPGPSSKRLREHAQITARTKDGCPLRLLPYYLPWSALNYALPARYRRILLNSSALDGAYTGEHFVASRSRIALLIGELLGDSDLWLYFRCSGREMIPRIYTKSGRC